jgi:U3 small nucleolar RNA-associated protein 16
LKRQASNKRKREGDLELHPKKSVRRNSGEGDDQDYEEAETSKGTAQSLKLGPGNRLPEFLPEEYLEDNESDEDMSLKPVQRVKRAKKTKFTELVEKKPKDIRKGSTTYRVAEARSTKLAPKSSSNARSVKESWLQGRTGSSRKSFSGGFFKAR